MTYLKGMSALSLRGFVLHRPGIPEGNDVSILVYSLCVQDVYRLASQGRVVSQNHKFPLVSLCACVRVSDEVMRM